MRLSEILMLSVPLENLIKEYTIPEMAAGDEKEISQEEWDEAMKLMKDHNAQADKSIKGFYYIDVTGKWEVYFTLWRWKDIDPRFAGYIKNPIYMGNQTTNFLTSVKKALNRIPKAAPFQIMTDQNREGLIGRNAARSNETLKFTFGKYRGQSLGEVYLENPSYFAWLAKNQDPKYAGSKLNMAIQTFAQMYYEEVTKQNQEKFKDVQYVAQQGGSFEGEVEVYKIDQRQGQSFSYYGKPQMYTIAKASDANGNKFIITNLDKAFPKHKIEKGVKVKIRAKVTGNIEILGNKFNKLGYVKGLDSGNAPQKVDPYQQQPVSVNQPVVESSTGLSTTPLGDTFQIKTTQPLYRCITLRDWDRVEKQGFLDSDQRGCVQDTEGVNLATSIPTAKTYCCKDDWSVLLKIDPTGLTLHGYKYDHYIRTWDKIPLDNIEPLEKIPPEGVVR